MTTNILQFYTGSLSPESSGGGGGSTNYNDLSNKPKINNVTLSGNKTAGDLGLQSETAEATLTTESTQLAANTVFTGGELASVALTAPTSPTTAFTCQVNFTSGTTPTTFSLPSTILLKGDDVNDSGVLVPVASKIYSIMFYSNGNAIRGIVIAEEVA